MHNKKTLEHHPWIHCFSPSPPMISNPQPTKLVQNIYIYIYRLVQNICVYTQIDVTSTSHIATYHIPWICEVSNVIHPTLCLSIFAACPQDPWGSEVLDPFVAPMALLDQSLPDRSAAVSVKKNSWKMVGVLLPNWWGILNVDHGIPIEEKDFFFQAPILDLEEIPWRIRIVFHKSSAMCSRKSVVYRVETESSCWWKVQKKS